VYSVVGLLVQTYILLKGTTYLLDKATTVHLIHTAMNLRMGRKPKVKHSRECCIRKPTSPSRGA